MKNLEPTPVETLRSAQGDILKYSYKHLALRSAERNARLKSKYHAAAGEEHSIKEQFEKSRLMKIQN